jgi:hypothetical protein
MTRFLMTLLLVLGTCAPAHAAMITTWSGPGPHACTTGDCPQDWAEAQLSEDRLAELRLIQEVYPEPTLIMVEDGTVFTMMTYYNDGPMANHGTTVAALDLPEGAMGWQMDGWAFVKINACQNWAVIQTGENIPVFSVPPVYEPPSVYATMSPPTVFTPPGTPLVPWTPWTPTDTPCCTVTPPCCTPVDPPISPVPTLPSWVYFLTAMLSIPLVTHVRGMAYA